MRFRIRHAQQTIADLVESHLVAQGWTADPHPWEIDPVVFEEVHPGNIEDIETNTVSTLIDESGPQQVHELGGGVRKVEYQLYIDVFGQQLSVALSIAQDVQDLLTGKTTPLMDYNTSPPTEVVGAYIEFPGPRVERPAGSVNAADLLKNWRIVRDGAWLYYSAED